MGGVLPTKILAFIISTAMMAKAHGMQVHPLCRALYQSLRTTQSVWRGPCDTYSKTMDCSLLFGNYFMPNLNPRINAGFINPLTRQLATHRHLGFNVFEYPELCGVNVLRPSIVYTTQSTLRRVNNFDHLSGNVLLSHIDNLPLEDTREFETTTDSNKDVTESDNSIDLTPDDTADVFEVPTIGPFNPTMTPEYEHNAPSTFQSPMTSEEPAQMEAEVAHVPTPGLAHSNETLFEIFKETLDRLERKFFLTTFQKLTAISPENRKENGISFLQSGLLLHLLLVTLSTEMDLNVTREIDHSLGLKASRQEKIDMVKLIASWLPQSSEDLKFRWSSRLVLGRAARASRQFQQGAAAAALALSWLNGTETPRQITHFLNELVEEDSGGAIHDTFEEEEVSGGVCAAGVAVLYVRGRWRAAPTLLNGSQPFHDAASAPPRATSLFRINDLMGYAYLHEWNAEAIEIAYATPGLSLLMVVPKEPSLARLVAQVARAGLGALIADMRQLRLSVTLPLYTLRMTLLLPNKLQHMGMPSLVMANNTECHSLKLSHAVQRLMFWAEAGRNAYKDDGIEWDPRPEMELVLDRPYLFFVRWNNITLMNGNFVL